jgi:hypothetical protein
MLPGCGAQSNGGYCDCVDAPLTVDAPTMYFVLDKSGSMSELNKWPTVHTTVTAVVRQVGARAKFGAMIFPGGDGLDCNLGAELISVRQGDVPAQAEGPVAAAFDAALGGIRPFGGTPTAATLGEVLARLRAQPGRTFVILATDGGPNCDASAMCDATGCQLNIESANGCKPGGPSCCVPPYSDQRDCLDAQPSYDAAAALAKAGIPVYVIGVPGSGVYASVLDELAVAGGTALVGTPKYYRVDDTSAPAALEAALKKVAAKIVATCTFKLAAPPMDPGLVNVYFDEEIVPKDPNWTIDGDTLTLQGLACDTVMNGDVIDVRIIVGCPSVIH